VKKESSGGLAPQKSLYALSLNTSKIACVFIRPGKTRIAIDATARYLHWRILRAIDTSLGVMDNVDDP
jgi:hypothetical protein